MGKTAWCQKKCPNETVQAVLVIKLSVSHTSCIDSQLHNSACMLVHTLIRRNQCSEYNNFICTKDFSHPYTENESLHGWNILALNIPCTQECVIVKTCHIMTMHDQFIWTNKI